MLINSNFNGRDMLNNQWWYFMQFWRITCYNHIPIVSQRQRDLKSWSLSKFIACSYRKQFITERKTSHGKKPCKTNVGQKPGKTILSIYFILISTWLGPAYDQIHQIRVFVEPFFSVSIFKNNSLNESD